VYVKFCKLVEAYRSFYFSRFSMKSPDIRTLFRALTAWYVELPEVKAKRSYNRDQRSVKLLFAWLGDRLLKFITPAQVESYKQNRLFEVNYKGTTTKPATVNREPACLQTRFSKGVKNGKAGDDPVWGVKHLKENNIRDRVLTSEE
jgi:hypothetical protein